MMMVLNLFIQSILLVLLNKRGVGLLVVEHRHTPETKFGGEGKRSLLKCCINWGLGDSQAPGSSLQQNIGKKPLCSPKY